MKTTGERRSRRLATRQLACWSWVLHPLPMAQTERAGCLRETDPATGFSVLCTGPASPTSRLRRAGVTASSSTTRGLEFGSKHGYAACADWLAQEIALLPDLRVVVALGGFGWDAFLRVLEGRGWKIPRPKPAFGHLARVELAGEGRRLWLVGSYHPSQQNTFTGRLTEEMFDAVWSEAADLLAYDGRFQLE